MAPFFILCRRYQQSKPELLPGKTWVSSKEHLTPYMVPSLVVGFGLMLNLVGGGDQNRQAGTTGSFNQPAFFAAALERVVCLPA